MTISERAFARRKPRVLCVDDEPNLLAGLEYTLRKQYDVTTAVGGRDGLRALGEDGPFLVVVSDFAMPEMTGAEFLAQARILAPDAVRILLTGHASMQDTIDTVNQGTIFRFLTKPCEPADLLRALDDAVEQARLVTADREIGERKLEAMSRHLMRAERLAALGTLAGAIGGELTNLLGAYDDAIGAVRAAAADGRPASDDQLRAFERVREKLSDHARYLRHLGRPSQDVGPGRITDLGQSIGDALAILRSAGLLRAADVLVDLPAAPVRIAMSLTDAERVFVNVLKNAVEAVPEGRRPGIEVRVSGPDAAGRVVCAVVDNGAGIARANMPLLFEPYYTTKADRGTGLGLFVVRQIVQRAGGEVAVDSREGEGTTFTLTLPQAPAV